MKQAKQNTTTTQKSVSPALNTLKQKADSAEKAAEKAFADFEKKQTAYKEALQNEPAKNVFFQIWTDMKIAKLTFKIKRAALKLAKYDYKFAKKAAKKLGQKASKESVVTEANASKQVEKKAKAPKKAAAA